MSVKFVPVLVLVPLVLLSSCRKDDVERTHDSGGSTTQVRKIYEMSAFQPLTPDHDTSTVLDFEYDNQSRLVALHWREIQYPATTDCVFEYDGSDSKPWKMTEANNLSYAPMAETLIHFLFYDGDFVQKDSIVSSLGTYRVQEVVPSGNSYQVLIRTSENPAGTAAIEVVSLADGQLVRSDQNTEAGHIYTATYLNSPNPLARIIPAFLGRSQVLWTNHIINLQDKLVLTENYTFSNATYDPRKYEYVFREDGYPVQKNTAANDDYRRLYYVYN
ncbi:MAG: hypothetical protein EOO09_01945 [Chitinophagaceae bacterium]|nr:MAG: hypothetical protein EOO09_01945 [Chitinophagaceae bacterium]